MPEKSTPQPPAPEGERIAKVLSRAGVASRREAERMIEAGLVQVNGQTITSPALNVTDRDRITVSGNALPDREPARLWLYYKPEGLVTSTDDEKGRATVFDHLPEDMPRVMSVGRLDLNSEGLLLLTNDGELKRRLELPSTGWLRKYRVRVKGNPTDPDLEPLRRGIIVEGETFRPMSVILDRHQGANAWLTIGLREGRNREIRRAMNAIGLFVNRLIRVSYGPFRLGELLPGEVEEVRQKVLRDQLGEGDAGGDGSEKSKPGAAKGPRVPRGKAALPKARSAGPPPQGVAARAPAGKRRPSPTDGAAAKPAVAARGKAPVPAKGGPTRPQGGPRGKPSGKPAGGPAGKPPGKPRSRA
jgi:23S rRNA pseudouridine2605 synthase